MAATLQVRYRSSIGQPLISVTQVLTLAGRIDQTWFTPESAWRGQMVHDLTEQFDRGEDFVVPVGLEGYMDAYAEFVAVCRPVYHASELKVTNDLLGLGGRIDRVCTIWGDLGILDFKTGAQSSWHGHQLAAYNALRPTGCRWACYLNRAGGYRLVQYDDPMDHRRFMFDLARTRGTVTPNGDYWIST